MHSPWTRGVVITWLVFLCGMAGMALWKRHREHLVLRSKLVLELKNIAEDDYPSAYERGVLGQDLSPMFEGDEIGHYLWGHDYPNPPLSTSTWSSKLGSPQAMAIYLFNHGYASPEVERGLLLCEAMRVYDWKYLYPSVNNYDLRSRLIADGVEHFPSDPAVHVAAGELSLAAGDYELAQRELAAVLDDKAQHSKPLPEVCSGLGISQQHLRGRYACALTMTGDWAAADKQAALAKQAGDGADPPPGDDWDYSYRSADEQAVINKAQQARAVRQAVGRQYGLKHDQALLAPWIAQLAAFERKLAAVGQSSAAASPLNEQRYELQAALLRAFLLAHEWDKAVAAGAALEKLQNDAPYDAPNMGLRSASGLLLTRLAKHEKLGQTAEEAAQTQRTELLKTDAANPDLSVSKAERAREIEDEIQYSRQGELAGLLEADYLPFLLRTDLFADALKRSGRSLKDVLPEIQTVTQPLRGTYADSSNGKLRWK